MAIIGGPDEYGNLLDDAVYRFAKPTPSDNVNHPAHYISETGLETIDVIEAFTFDLKGLEAVCTANVIKYICRWKNKNGVEDLKKAQWYLNKLIDYISHNEIIDHISYNEKESN